MSKVLIGYHTFSGKTKLLAEAAAEGARKAGAEVTFKEVADTNIGDLAAADAILVATPQPFRSMAGETKKLFERLWKDREQITEGKPFGVIIVYNNDPAATVETMDRLCNHFKFSKVAEWTTVKAAEADAALGSCRELGAALAKGGPHAQV